MTRNSKKQEGIEDKINNNDDDNDNNSENDRNDEITDKSHKNNNNIKKIDINNGKSNDNNNNNEEVKTTTSSSLNNGLDTQSIEDSDCKSELTNVNKVSSTLRTVDSPGILNLFYLLCIIFHIILLNAYYK